MMCCNISNPSRDIDVGAFKQMRDVVNKHFFGLWSTVIHSFLEHGKAT